MAPVTNGLTAGTTHYPMGEDGLPYIPSPDLPGDEYFERVMNEPTTLGIKTSGVEIVEIQPGGWGFTTGLEIDDEIYSVNGIKFLHLSNVDRLDLVQGKRPLRIFFKRPAVKDGYFKVFMQESDGVKIGARFQGIRIADLLGANGWAAKAGLIVGDEIIGVAGE